VLRLMVDGPEGAIPFSVFLDTMQALLQAVQDTDRIAGHSSQASLDWTIVGLRVGSATAELADVARDGAPPGFADLVTRRVVAQLADLRAGFLPQDFSEATLKNLRNALRRFDAQGARGLRVADTTSGASAEVSREAMVVLDRLDTAGFVSTGSVIGNLDTIGLHRGYFVTVYEDLSKHAVRCDFQTRGRDRLLERAKQLLGTRVLAAGELSYGSHGRVQRMTLHQLEPMADEASQPRVADVFGIAPNLTGGADPVDHQNRLRYG